MPSIYRQVGESKNDFEQRCLRTCAAASDACFGLRLQSGGDKCTFYEASSPFVMTDPGTLIKKSSDSAFSRGGVKDVSNSNPEWTYDSSDDDDKDGDKKPVVGGHPSPGELTKPLDKPSTKPDGADGSADKPLAKPDVHGLRAAMGDGALIGVGVALALTGAAVGAALTLGIQRCWHRRSAATTATKTPVAGVAIVSEASEPVKAYQGAV